MIERLGLFEQRHHLVFVQRVAGHDRRAAGHAVHRLAHEVRAVEAITLPALEQLDHLLQRPLRIRAA